MAEVTVQELLQRIERLENELNSLKTTFENEYGYDFNIQRNEEA